MTAFSGGNRWVGFPGVGSPPVPPPLHRMALDRMGARTRMSPQISIDGQSVSRLDARRALHLLSQAFGSHEDLPRLAACLALARSLRQGTEQPDAWPQWVRNGVRRYTANPGAFSASRAIGLSRWGLASRPVNATPDRRKGSSPPAERVPSRNARSSLPGSRAPYTPESRFADQVSVPPLTLVIPGPALDHLPVDPTLRSALANVGWRDDSELRRRWLRLALLHSSYLEERAADVLVNADLLRMLGAVGGRWCHLYALDELLSDHPLASADEQSKVWANFSRDFLAGITAVLNADNAMFRGRGEELMRESGRSSPHLPEAIANQVIGVLCLLDGLPAVARLVKEAHRRAISRSSPVVDWGQLLDKHAGAGNITFRYQESGPDHQRQFTAVATDSRGRSAGGSAPSKKKARIAAAESFLRRYYPGVAQAANSSAQRHQDAQQFPPTQYEAASPSHEKALRDLLWFFELPSRATPLLSQALTHASWANQNQDLVWRFRQRDSAALAHLGSVVADALIAHVQATAVASRSLRPTSDEARIMAPLEDRVGSLFNELQLEAGLLLGVGVQHKAIPGIAAGSMQALLGVAWQQHRENLLARRPRVLDEWLRTPNGLQDDSTLLQQLCSEFKIEQSIEYTERGPDHDRRYSCQLRFSGGPSAVTVKGPFIVGKTPAKLQASSMVLSALNSDPDDVLKPVRRFLLQRQITNADVADPRRSLLRGWLGVDHVVSSDGQAFAQWATETEATIGPLAADDLTRLKSYYQRCLLLSRQGTLPILQSILSETTQWLQNAETPAEVKQDNRWNSFQAATAVLSTITSDEIGSVRGAISGWLDSAAGRIDINLSSDLLPDDQASLSATQSEALRVLLDVSSTTASGGRVNVSIYRRSESAYVSLTSNSLGLPGKLAELARLLEECVSGFVYVRLDDGWLAEFRYTSPITPTTLAELGQALDAVADQRPDLRSLARSAAGLIDLIEGDTDQASAQPDHRAYAAELHRRRGMI